MTEHVLLLVLILQLSLRINKLRKTEILHGNKEDIVIVLTLVGKLFQVIELTLIVLLIIEKCAKVPFPFLVLVS